MAGVAVEDGGAVADVKSVKGEEAGNWQPLAAAITAMTTSRPATRLLRIRVRRVLRRAGSLKITPQVKAAWCCQHVCDFRYAGDMRQL